MGDKPASRHRRLNKTVLFYGAGAIIWMGLIFWLSQQPALPSLPDSLLDLISKKLGHFFAYAILMALWWGAIRPLQPTTGRALILAFIITLLYAISDEWHQTFVPNRSGQVADVLVDAAGALSVCLIVLRRHSWRPR